MGGAEEIYLGEKQQGEWHSNSTVRELPMSKFMSETHSNWYGTSTWGVPYHKLGGGAGAHGGGAWRGEELFRKKAAWESGTQDEKFIHFNISHFQVHSRR